MLHFLRKIAFGAIGLIVSCLGFADGGHLTDPDGVFSGRALGGNAIVSQPDFYLRPYGISDWSCIHSDVDHVDFETVFVPASATISPTEFDIDGFSVTSNGMLRLNLPYGEMSPVYGSVWIDTPPLAWGYLYDSWSIHRCSGGIQEFCYACGRHHAVGGDGDCSHAVDCEARRDVRATCSCAPIFVPVNWDDDDCNGCEDREDDDLSSSEDETVLYRALGFARECCCDCSFGWESSLRNIRVSPSLRNWEEVNGPQSGGGIRIEATAASPTVGGASLTYDIYDETNGLFRTVTRHVTAANVRCRQDRDDDREWDADDRLMEDWYGPQWTVYRRDEPYVFWVDCEKPSDMEFGISCTQTNRLISVLSDSAFPREYQVDASCSNTTFDVRCVLSTGACEFVSTSFTINVVDTAIPEKTIVIGESADYEIADLEEVYWIVSDLDETECLEFSYGSSVSLGETLPVGDYLVSASMPGIGDEGSMVHCSTNVLHVTVPKILSIDLMDAVNELAHHTELYATNALVVRRAQKFRVGTKMSKNFDPDRFHVSFKMVDEFGKAPTTNDVPFSAGDMSHTDWYARKVGDSTTAGNYPNVLSDVSLPSTNCAVGVYHLIAQIALKSDPTNFLHTEEAPRDIIVLFNPWSSNDAVYMASNDDRTEYVVSENGRIWMGNGRSQTSKPWKFSQYSLASTCVALSVLSDQDYRTRSSPVLLARYFSWKANSQSATGILYGRWDGNYQDGVSPSRWKDSKEIFARYIDNGCSSVKYGQCWVFSGILTSLLRFSGIPSRPLTNFTSAHDGNGDGRIDVVYSSDGKRLGYPFNDSVWNFHVWCDVWMSRPDLQRSIASWQAVDGTPQELSNGLYQCGPAALEDIKAKRGGLYDVGFVTAEVSAGYYKHYLSADRSRIQRTEVVTNYVGKLILTKSPNGNAQLEITGDYK